MSDLQTPEYYLRAIEKILDDFVLEFEMIGIILIDRGSRIITTRDISDIFDTSIIAKMVSKHFPKIPTVEEYYSVNNFSWLIFQNDSQSLLVHPVGAKVVMGMLVNNEISLNFYKQQVEDLAFRLGKNFDNLYKALNK